MSDDQSEEFRVERAKYEPERYWSDRLGKDFTLRGVGHRGYPESYNEWIYRQKRRVLHQVLPQSGSGRHALDVGSGVGWVVAELCRAGWQPEGCDITALAVERLRARFADLDFFELELGKVEMPRADASYDLVTILDVTYHVVDDDVWARGVRDLARVLRPGGHLIVLDRFGAGDDDVAAHVRFRSLARWLETTRQCGLQLDTLRPAYRWLSREQDRGVMRHLPARLRGPLEFGLESLAPRSPHMRCARFRREA